MSLRIYFIDIDDTIVPHGKQELDPQVIQKFNSIYADGHQIYLFTARSRGTWIADFRRQGLKFEDVIYKPVADEYVVVDDRLVDAYTSIENVE